MDILENAKGIYELVKKLGQQDLLEKVADLRDQILSLREENQRLKEKVAQKEAFNMVYEYNCYFNIKEDGTKEGPYCSACWDNNSKTVRMIVGHNDFYSCPVCKHGVYGPNYQRPIIKSSSL